MARLQKWLLLFSTLMARTIFILGTDPEHCAELRDVLQARITDPIVTTSVNDPLPKLKESDTVIIAGEGGNAGVMYRRLIDRLEEQISRAHVLGELVRLSMTSLSLEDMLEKIVSKATEVLGD